MAELSLFRHLPHIQHINASITSKVSFASSPFYAIRFPGMIRSALPIHARHLDLRFCVTTVHEIRSIMDAILDSSSLSSTLEVLRLSFGRTLASQTQHTNSLVDLQFSQLSRFMRLHDLALCDIVLNENTLRSLGSVSCNLRTLNVNDGNWNDNSSLSNLLHSSHQRHQLTSLNVSETSFELSGMQLLVSALPNLIEFYSGYTQGPGALESLYRLPSLQTANIVLNGCDLVSAYLSGCKKFRDWTVHFPKLRSLTIFASQLPNVSPLRLLPELQVVQLHPALLVLS